jgi:hypothetical protein
MSTLKVNTIQNTSGVEVYTCKAWVNFNGTGTVAIRASGNVSSITDNAQGDYLVNFTTAMSDTNYLVVAQAMTYSSATSIPGLLALKNSGGNLSSLPTGKNTSSVRVAGTYGNNGGASVDIADCGVAIFR